MRVRWSQLLLLVAACGGPRPGAAPPADAPARELPPRVRISAPGSYQATGMVLASHSHGPELCLGAVLLSYPPQCSGVPLLGWDWARVDGEERVGEAVWGDYHVVGEYDGRTLTVTRPPGPPQRPDPSPPVSSPCSEPAGGWDRPDPASSTQEHFSRATTAASAQPDFAGLWTVDPTGPAREDQIVARAIVNVAFTGDLERHTAELRQHWGGALCVVQHAHTQAELFQLQQTVNSTLRELGVHMLISRVDVVADVVRVEVEFADATHQAVVDERHGPGAIVLRSRIRPAP